MQPQYSSLTNRIQSIFIDGVFICVLMFFFSWLLDKFTSVPDWTRIALFFGILGWLSFLTITANKERRAIHYLISGSVVINIRQYQQEE